MALWLGACALGLLLSPPVTAAPQRTNRNNIDTQYIEITRENIKHYSRTTWNNNAIITTAQPVGRSRTQPFQQSPLIVKQFQPKTSVAKAAAGLLTACTLLSPLAAQAKPASLDDKLATAVEQYEQRPNEKKLAAIRDLLAKGAHAHRPQPAEYEGPQGMSALAVAISNNDADLVDLLLTQKNDLEIPVYRDSGNQPLTFAISQIDGSGKPSPQNLRIIKALIAAGANVNAVSTDGINAPLLQASGLRLNAPSPELMRLLLSAGANPNLRNQDGATALMGMAASNLDAMKLLIGAGIDVGARAKSGATALNHVCERYVDLRGKPDPQAAERIKLLLKPGTDLNTVAWMKKSGDAPVPLMSAALVDNADCVRALIQAGASPDARAYSDAAAAGVSELKSATVRKDVLANPSFHDDATLAIFRNLKR